MMRKLGSTDRPSQNDLPNKTVKPTAARASLNTDSNNYSVKTLIAPIQNQSGISLDSTKVNVGTALHVSGSFKSVLNSSSTNKPQTFKAVPNSQSQINKKSNTPNNSSSLIILWQEALVQAVRDLSRDNTLLYSLVYKTHKSLESLAVNSRILTDEKGGINLNYNHQQGAVVSSSTSSFKRLTSRNTTRANNSNTNQEKFMSLDNIQSLDYDVERLSSLTDFVALLNPQKFSSGHYPNNNIRSSNEIIRIIGRPLKIQSLSTMLQDSLEKVSQIVHSPNLVSIDKLHHCQQELSATKKQLDNLKVNWEKAMETMKQWQTYKQDHMNNDNPMNLL